ncbi:MAG TPA: NAD-dependent epimerase/dehydratase family protein [Actinomycetes bacterium]|jgi:nucleoside-diphosphate-sugar epimerase|nr:NAD-dependent epimerase/dehydratase family protein [Actinomycetes bacterium]
MIALVTGAAGFVGSHLSAALLDDGAEVLGVDAFTDYYSRLRKEQNLAHLRGRPGFSFLEDDLSEAPLAPLLDGVDCVFHLAGQPGVRASWGPDFVQYVRHNIAATQRLLEASMLHPLRKFVFASSSSVYGDAEAYPTPESLRPQPVSPYGVTKLAAEHLCEVYRTSFGVPVASLRLFTVYGPRQRPDMAFSRLVAAALAGEEFEVYGDGEQTRDFTFVGDVVKAMRDAAASDWCGVANIGGGSRTSLNAVLDIVSDLCGELRVVRRPQATGDVRHTAADTSVAQAAFGYRPRTSLPEGLAAMVAWARSPEKALR